LGDVLEWSGCTHRTSLAARNARRDRPGAVLAV